MHAHRSTLPSFRRLARGSLVATVAFSAIGAAQLVGAPPAHALGVGNRPTISMGDASVTEGNSGTTQLVFTATLSGRSVHTATVDYTTVDGTALAASDYSAMTGTLSFPKGVTTQTVSVSVNGDTEGEDAETLTVQLSSPVDSVIGTGTGNGTIVDDDCTILGTPGNDVILGTPADDVICGLDGTDIIKGLDGNDQIDGNGGSDRMVGGRGDDIINGGAGDDWVRYSDSPNSVTIDLSQSYADDGQGGRDTLVSVERGFGSKNADDTLIGDDGDNVLSGLAGNDTLYGMGGNDRLLGGFGDDTIYGGDGDDRLEGDPGTDTCIDTVGTNSYLVCEVLS
ncbi:MAG: calcium-binding protein [Actinomycetota bacterium]